MGPNHMVADVRGVATGCQGCGFGSVRDYQLVNGLHAHTRLHAPDGQVWPVCALPVFYGRVCVLSAVHRRVRPRDTRPLTGGNRELFQDRTYIYHQPKSIHYTVELNIKDPFFSRMSNSYDVPLTQVYLKVIFELNVQ